MSDSIVPPHLAIKAMRDNGYKNAAYALAELMDNSIQAGATSVQLLCIEKTQIVNTRSLLRIDEIAILDDGEGMDDSVLSIALQFGNGTRLDSPGDGIGKFGMGLPNSSISQAKHVDVYTWQDGIESSIYSYIDVDEIASGEMTTVQTPIKKQIPKEWLQRTNFGTSGTLVVWKNLDRVSWAQGQTIIRNSELLIGRMYRYFLHEDKVKIAMKVFNGDSKGHAPTFEKFALPNDPLYLMDKTSCPAPFDNSPMFTDGGFHDLEFDVMGQKVIVKFAYAKEEARKKIGGQEPGKLHHGKHAARNVGVSIVRAGRELDLDLSWSDPSDPRDRWWGVEVNFPPSLDEIFGVTNNKQHAHKFSELAKVDLDEFLEECGYSSMHDAKEAMKNEADERLLLLEVAKFIRNNIGQIRKNLRAQTANTRSGPSSRHDTSSQETGTAVTKKRQEEGNVGSSDEGEKLPEKDRIQAIADELEGEGVPKDTAREIAEVTISRKLKYTVIKQDETSPSFFNVKTRGGAIIVSLNTAHPAYSHLVELVEELPSEDATKEELIERLGKAKTGLELLIMAWARFEDEQPDGLQKERIQEVRWDWGRMARDFLRGSSE